METEGRTLQQVAGDVINQVQVKEGKGRRLHVIFSPESLSDKTQVVYGNPPIEGDSEHALYLLSYDYGCHFAIIEETTLVFYDLDSL